MRKVELSDSEWRARLSPTRYAVLRRGATESPFSGKYYEFDDAGVYRCGACESPLFSSVTKYRSGSGWPSFFQPVSEDSVALRPDNSHGMRRMEVACATCGSHLGHVFDDGPMPTGKRFCINSAALDFVSDENGETTA